MSNIIWNRAKYRRSIRKQGGSRGENFALMPASIFPSKLPVKEKSASCLSKYFFCSKKVENLSCAIFCKVFLKKRGWYF